MERTEGHLSLFLEQRKQEQPSAADGRDKSNLLQTQSVPGDGVASEKDSEGSVRSLGARGTRVRQGLIHGTGGPASGPPGNDRRRAEPAIEVGQAERLCQVYLAILIGRRRRLMQNISKQLAQKGHATESSILDLVRMMTKCS